MIFYFDARAARYIYISFFFYTSFFLVYTQITLFAFLQKHELVNKKSQEYIKEKGRGVFRNIDQFLDKYKLKIIDLILSRHNIGTELHIRKLTI